MDLIWNEFELKKPTLITVPVKKVDFNIPDLRKELNTYLAFYESQGTFDETAALCSRLLARRKNSFKKMSGYKSLCKLNAALCRLLRLDVKTILENFLGLLPEFQPTLKFGTHLPPRGNLDYLLIRLIGLQRIYVRILDCCEDIARYFGKLLRNNFFMDIIVLILAVISSIWKMTIALGNRTTKLYQVLHGFRQHFPEPGEPWLPNDFNFPEKIEFVDKLQNLQQAEEKSPKVACNTVIATTSKQISHLSRSITKGVSLAQDMDVGVEISRDSMTPTFDLKKYNNIKAICKFLPEEDKLRRTALNSCITKNISEKDWEKLNRQINYWLNSNNKGKAVKLFMSVLRNKI